MIPDESGELSLLAGEYVLGLLDAAAAAEIEAALPGHAALQAAIDFWENRLHPMVDAVPPAVPAADGWPKIQTRLRALAPAQAAMRPGPDRALRRWRGATAGFAALAACLGIYIVASGSFPAKQAPQVAVLNAPQSPQLGWLATIDRGRLMVRAIGVASVPAGKAYEVWAIAPGATNPASLGVIRPDGQLSVVTARNFDRVMLAVSLEPSGGSPIGLPTGPVVFVGTVSQL